MNKVFVDIGAISRDNADFEPPGARLQVIGY